MVIDVNKSYLCGEIVFLYVKGHATATFSNGKLFDFTIPTTKVLQSGCVFPISVGGEWSVDGVGYGYISDSAITGGVANGKYFEVTITLLLDR